MTKRRKKRSRDLEGTSDAGAGAVEQSDVKESSKNKQAGSPMEGKSIFSRFRVSRWKSALIAFGVASVLVIFAPEIVAKTPLFSMVLSNVLDDFDGQVEVDSVSLGWMSRVVLRDVVVRDAQGQVMAKVAELSTDRVLLGFAIDSSKVGRITIRQPELNVKLDATSSNWEKSLASYLSKDLDDTDSAKAAAMEVAIVDGRVEIVDTQTQQNCELSNLQCTAAVDAGNAIQAKLETQVAQNEASGRLDLAFEWQPTATAAETSAGKGNVEATLEQLPLQVVRPFLHRFAPEIQDLSGVANGTSNASWGDSAELPTLNIKTQTRIEDLYAAADYLDEHVQVEWLEMNGDAAAADGTLNVESCVLTSPMGHIDASGQTRLRSLGSVDVTKLLLDSIEFGSTKLKGRIDLAEVARRFPRTIRLRGDTAIATGEIVWDAAAESSDRGPRLTGTIQTKNLVAMQSNREIRLRQPVQLTFGIVHSDGGIEVERFVGHANFLTVEASGRFSKGNASAVVRLRELQAELEQFIDLSGHRLSGRIAANASWQQTDDTRLNAKSHLTATNFAWHRPNRPPWQESRIDVSTQWKAEMAGLQIQRVLFGQADVVAGKERLIVATSQPITLNADGNQAFPLHVEVNGELRNWQQRSQLFVDMPPVEVSGFVDSVSDVTVTDSRLELTRSRTKLLDLVVKNAGRSYSERKAIIDVAGNIDLQPLAMTIPKATIASTSISARADHLRIRLGDQVSVSGDLSFRGRLDRISRLVGLQQQGLMASGDIDGYVGASQKGGTVQFDGRLNAEQPTWMTYGRSGAREGVSRTAGAWQQVWREPRFNIVAKGSFDTTNGKLTLEKSDVATPASRITATGTVTRLGQDCVANIRGITEYDWDILSQRFDKTLGTHVRLTGKESKPFQIQGPFFSNSFERPREDALTRHVSSTNQKTGASAFVPAALKAQAQIGWKNAHAYGLDIQESVVHAALESQRINFRPFELPVAEGRINASPLIDLRDRRNPLFRHGKGRVVESVRLSPELCSTWLKFVAPMLADATAAEGLFSVDLAHANVPLYDPYRSAVGGTMKIDSAQIRPGVMARQFFDLANQIKSLVRGGQASRVLNADRTLVAMPPQEILFELREGAIGHQGLVMQFGDVEVRTEGWVTLDERVQMTAMIPILPKWVQDEKLLRGLAGQNLKIPIGGTLRQPQLDRRAVRQLTQQAVRGAAEGLIQDELGKQLKKLFK